MQITIRSSKPDCCPARLGVMTTRLCKTPFCTIVCVSILCESTDKPKVSSVEWAQSLYRTELRNPLISDQHCCWFVSIRPNRIVRRMCWKLVDDVYLMVHLRIQCFFRCCCGCSYQYWASATMVIWFLRCRLSEAQQRPNAVVTDVSMLPRTYRGQWLCHDSQSCAYCKNDGLLIPHFFGVRSELRLWWLL